MVGLSRLPSDFGCYGQKGESLTASVEWGVGPLAKRSHYTQNPPIEYQSVSDTWSLATVVSKVELKLLHLIREWQRNSEVSREGLNTYVHGQPEFARVLPPRKVDRLIP